MVHNLLEAYRNYNSEKYGKFKCKEKCEMRNTSKQTEKEKVTLLSLPFKIPEMQRLSYDLSPVQELTVPIIWLVGPPGSGKTSQSQIIEETFGFNLIKVGELLRKHASNETDRGRVIKENVDKGLSGNVPDTIVIDLIKEEMLNTAKWTSGYLLNGFPKNKRQADLFVNEIGRFDVIIHLTSDMKTLIARNIASGQYNDAQMVRKDVLIYNRIISRAINRYSSKTEKFDTTRFSIDKLFPRIQSALNIRIFGGENSGRENADELTAADRE